MSDLTLAQNCGTLRNETSKRLHVMEERNERIFGNATMAGESCMVRD